MRGWNHLEKENLIEHIRRITDAVYLPKGGKAVDAGKLDGFHSNAFLKSNAKAVDSDKLDGLQPSVSAVANTIVQRNPLGYIEARANASKFYGKILTIPKFFNNKSV